MSNVTATPPKNRTVYTAFVNASSLGSNALITAPASTDFSIRVLSVDANRIMEVPLIDFEGPWLGYPNP